VTKAEIEADLSLYIYGHDLDPGLVTEKLQIKPEVSSRRGDMRTGAQGQSAIQKVGVWACVRSGPDVGTLVDQLLVNLGPRGHLLDELLHAEEVVLDIFIMIPSELDDVNFETELTVGQMKTLSSMGIPVRFTFCK